MKITTIRRRLLSLHKAQQKLFLATVKSTLREYAKIPEAKEFLDSVTGLRDLLAAQTKGVESIFAAAELLPPGEGNRSPELMRPKVGSGCGPHCYDYLTAQSKVVAASGDLDEWSGATACSADMTAAAKPSMDSDPDQWKFAVELSWRLMSTQYQILALVRQAEAITATHEAVLRSYGLQVWQGRKRHLRWEGDSKDGE